MPALPAALALESAVWLVADHRNPYGYDQELLDYHQDLIAPHGLPLREDLVRTGTGVSFTDLAHRLVGAARRSGLPWPQGPDLLVLAYALPDYHPLTTVSADVNRLLGGGARSFAVSEQGLRAPYTALRLARAYARSGRCARLALLVLEQTTLPYAEPLLAQGRLADSGALLFFGQDGGYEPVSPPAAVPEGRLASALALAADGVPEQDVLVVAGPGADAAELAAAGLPCHRAGPGSYCTGVWLDLARHHRDWAARHQALVLCDTDPRTGRSSVLALHHRGAAPNAARLPARSAHR
ncbi:hypothetical protein [Actinacidiphila paucisporea]|uniref:Uncharacterized protein n=1 Tax=Actinacidiphila paucisporea TaxID=310782 RepID=A0A1M7M4D7_9ACTN|nr:hypothetical protein [Actinacidiphila paucisporea]SHM85498.1 hypothetical protein SAMN05216499_11586 [Actinacidiphila paucisporea]